jgi:hypothetical protein
LGVLVLTGLKGFQMLGLQDHVLPEWLSGKVRGCHGAVLGSVEWRMILVNFPETVYATRAFATFWYLTILFLQH